MRRLVRSAIAVSVVATAGATTAVLTAGGASAAAFAGGDFVIYQVGDGASALTTAAAPVSLVEYSSTGGTPIQKIALRTADGSGEHALTASGTSTSEGELSRSSNGSYLVATGYDAAPGTTGPASSYSTAKESITATAPSSVARTIARVDGNGLVDTSTALTSANTPSVIRSATTTDGTVFEVAGSPQTPANPSGVAQEPAPTGGGLVAAALGSSTTAAVAGSDANNLNGVQIDGTTAADAVTFVSSSDTLNRLYSAQGTTLTAVPGVSATSLPYGFAFIAESGNPSNFLGTGLNTLYVADGADHAGAIDKYTYNGTTWGLAGKKYLDGVLGLAAVPTTGTGVSILATTSTGAYTLTDPDGTDDTAFSGTPTLLTSAPANDQFRGVALAPTAPTTPTLVIHSPTAAESFKSGSTTLPFSAEVAANGSGVSAVTAQIDTKAAVSATEAGTSDGDGTWSASLPLAGLAAGTHTLTVRATGGSAPGTTTASTKFVLASAVPTTPKGDVGKGTTSFLSSLIKHTGFKSTTIKQAPKHNGKHVGLATKKKGTATFTYYGKTLTLHLRGGKTSGEITVTIDGKKHTVNLQKKKTELFTVKYKASKTKAHKVSIKAAHKKAKKSKGYLATLGWVVVA